MRFGYLLERVRDLVAEMTMVVLGILIAFALNSWWEGREAAQRRQAHLRALERDFAENVRRLDNAVGFEERVSASSAHLLVLSGRPGPLPADTALNLIGRVFSSHRFEPVMGAYEGIVAAGGVAQLQDPELGSGLAEFAAALRDSYSLDYASRIYFDLIGSATGRMGFLFRSFPAGGPGGRPPARLLPTQPELTAVLGDPRIRDGLALRALAERDVANTYRELRRQAAGVLQRVRADLAEE